MAIEAGAKMELLHMMRLQKVLDTVSKNNNGLRAEPKSTIAMKMQTIVK